jgi:hypothetical protein
MAYLLGVLRAGLSIAIEMIAYVIIWDTGAAAANHDFGRLDA